MLADFLCGVQILFVAGIGVRECKNLHAQRVFARNRVAGVFNHTPVGMNHIDNRIGELYERLGVPARVRKNGDFKQSARDNQPVQKRRGVVKTLDEHNLSLQRGGKRGVELRGKIIYPRRQASVFRQHRRKIFRRILRKEIVEPNSLDIPRNRAVRKSVYVGGLHCGGIGENLGQSLCQSTRRGGIFRKLFGERKRGGGNRRIGIAAELGGDKKRREPRQENRRGKLAGIARGALVYVLQNHIVRRPLILVEIHDIKIFVQKLFESVVGVEFAPVYDQKYQLIVLTRRRLESIAPPKIFSAISEKNRFVRQTLFNRIRNMRVRQDDQTRGADARSKQYQVFSKAFHGLN